MDGAVVLRPSVMAEPVAPFAAAALHPPNRMTRLRIFLRVLSGGMLAAFIPWITLILLNAPVLGPGGVLAPLLRFQPYNANYETMLAAIHIVWAIMLWRAANDPANHRSLIDFTMWANAAHGLVMVVVTPIQKGALMMVVESLPLLIIAAVLVWLRPVRLRTVLRESTVPLCPSVSTVVQ
jgi:hypothetical protein